MKAVIQRVSRAEVRVGDEVTGSIGNGLLVLLGVARGDSTKDVQYLVEKVCALRIFGDDAGKMNLSLRDVNGSMLVVSQFTLLADTQRGRRPSYIDAADPDVADALYESFVQAARLLGVTTETGRFAAHMQVELVNDGPVTIILDSQARKTD